MKVREVTQEEFITNSLSCAGCASLLAVRLALKVLGRRTVCIVPAGCMSTVNAYWPQFPFRVPFFVSPFAATGAILQGVSAGFRYRGVENITVLAIAGDGGTADIGMSSFSQAIISRHKFIYLCVDNQAYMNTGIQWSSTTPPWAITTTTPVPEVIEGSTRKDLFNIAVVHGIPYAATASPSYPLDYIEKVRKAASVDGPSFIQILVPCPPGWGFPTEKTIEIGRLAVESRMWNLREYKDGHIRLTHIPEKRIPVSEYLTTQTRFRRMKPEHTARLQSMVDDRAAAIEANCNSQESKVAETSRGRAPLA